MRKRNSCCEYEYVHNYHGLEACLRRTGRAKARCRAGEALQARRGFDYFVCCCTDSSHGDCWLYYIR